MNDLAFACGPFLFCSSDGEVLTGCWRMKNRAGQRAGPIVFLPTAPYSSSNENGVRSTASATGGKATQSEKRERAGSGDGGKRVEVCTELDL